MIPCILLAVAVFLAKNSGLKFATNNENMTNPDVPNSMSGHQARFRDWYTEQSMAARPQVDLRLPFGPNPQQKYIQEMQFFDNPYYVDQYQKHLTTARISNQDWRLDTTTNGILSSWPQKPHQPEDNLHKIKSFADQNTLNNIPEFFQQQCY